MIHTIRKPSLNMNDLNIKNSYVVMESEKEE